MVVDVKVFATTRAVFDGTCATAGHERIFSGYNRYMYFRAGERGATMLDVIVGSALMTLVFVGIVGAFRLSIDAVSNNKARAGAIALANEQLEYVRSLQYNAIGTSGGIPAGAIPQIATSTLNAVEYTRRTFISYEDDPNDGEGAGDTNGITTDFKAVKVSVSWTSRQATRTLTMATRVSPPTGLEQAIPSGTIVVNAVDSSFQPVQNAQVRILNPNLNPSIDLTTYTDSTGVATILGAPAGAGYRVSVTKAGFSTAQTHGVTATNTNPIPAHLGVALYQTTAATFEIDVLSALTIETYKVIEDRTWADSFVDGTNVASTTGVDPSGGVAQLAGGEGSYDAEGSLTSIALSDPYLFRWKEFSWDHTVPAGTSITYRVFDEDYQPLSNGELSGNITGFTVSPIDLTGISTTSHSMLRVGATLTTNDASTTPLVNSWSLAYESGPEPIGNIDLTMHGAKTIGSSAGGSLVYKYDRDDLETNASGSLSIPEIEWDSYDIVVPSATGYDVASSCAALPFVISPSSSVTMRLYLAPHTTNSLLVDVRSAAGVPIADATVSLTRGAFSSTIETDTCSQSFFSSLSSGTSGGGNAYSIEVSATGFSTFTSTEVNVSGTSRLSVILN